LLDLELGQSVELRERTKRDELRERLWPVALSPDARAYGVPLLNRNDWGDLVRFGEVRNVFEVVRLTPSPTRSALIPTMYRPAAAMFTPAGSELAVAGELPFFALPSTVGVWPVAGLIEGFSRAPGQRDKVKWESGPIVDSFSVTALGWSRDGKLLAAAGDANAWAMARRASIRDEVERRFDVQEREKRFRANQHSDSAKALASANLQRDAPAIICCWDAQNGTLLREWRGKADEREWTRGIWLPMGRTAPIAVCNHYRRGDPKESIELHIYDRGRMSRLAGSWAKTKAAKTSTRRRSATTGGFW